MSKNILIVAAHQDDEALGCGGSIARHTYLNDNVHCIFFTDGVSSRDAVKNNEKQKRKKSCTDASKILGIKNIKFYDFPDNKMDNINLLDIVKLIEIKIKEFSPDIIYTHFENDLNVDHNQINRAVLTATRPINGKIVPLIYCFEVVSSTEWSFSVGKQFNPTVFINIKDFWDIKVKSINCYKDEMRDFPHPRSIENLDALSRFRGSSAGLERAEAFVLARSIIE